MCSTWHIEAPPPKKNIGVLLLFQEHVLALRAPLVLSETETFRSDIGWRLSEHFGWQKSSRSV